jgi:hypothetical protein
LKSASPAPLSNSSHGPIVATLARGSAPATQLIPWIEF